MDLRIVRDDLQHAALLEQAKELALLDPLPESNEAERLALISVLLEKYEAEQFRIESPDPVDAIIYRLAELGLKQRDLADIIGSKSRASEILSRKRDLTVDMIRLIHDGLRIPVEVLIGERKQETAQDKDIAWEKFPVKEMKKRGLKSPDYADAFVYATADLSHLFDNPLAGLKNGDTMLVEDEQPAWAVFGW